MKRIIPFVLITAILFTLSATALAFSFDFSPYSDEELIELETAIQKEKIDRGIAKSADVPAGAYIVGKDLPAGDYTVSLPSSLTMAIAVINVEHKDGLVDMYSISNSSEVIGKMTLKEDDVLHTITPIILTVYSGVISFN